MKITKSFLVAGAAVGAAALFALPSTSIAFSLIGGNLGISTSGNGYQRDFRIWNNAADSTANNNLVADAAFPGTTGAVMAVWKGAKAWDSTATGSNLNFDFDFQGTATSSPGDQNVVSWGTSGCGGGTLAYTTSPIANGWNILMCEGFTWADGPGSPSGSQVDIQGIVCHELGHALGLGHTNSFCGTCNDTASGAATMCAFICNNGVSERVIQADDKNGINAIYGAKPVGKPTITGLSGSTATGGSLTINGTNFPATVNVKFTAGTTQNTGAIPGVVFNAATSGGTSVTVTVPATAQDGNVFIWAPGSSVLSNGFPIDVNVGPPPVPQITSLSGNTFNAFSPGSVTLTGLNFTGATIVTVGATQLLPVLGFVVINDTSIQANLPNAAALGSVGITVTTPNGTSNSQSITYIETQPLVLAGPLFLTNGGTASYSWGGKANQIALFNVATTNTSTIFNGQPFLLYLFSLPIGTTNAAGLGSLSTPVNGAPVGLNLFTQILTVAPPGTDLSTVQLSNIHGTQVIF